LLWLRAPGTACCHVIVQDDAVRSESGGRAMPGSTGETNRKARFILSSHAIRFVARRQDRGRSQPHTPIRSLSTHPQEHSINITLQVTDLDLQCASGRRDSIRAPRIFTNNQHPQTGCAILSLPPEIRNEIIALALAIPVKKSGIALTIPRDHEGKLLVPMPASQEPSVFSVLQTCQLINNEAHLLFYAIQRLEFELYDNAPEHAEPVLHQPSTAQLAAMEKVTFTVKNMKCLPCAFVLLERCVNLKRLCLKFQDPILISEFNEPIVFEDFCERFEDEEAALRAGAKKLSKSLRTVRVLLRCVVNHTIPAEDQKTWKQAFGCLAREMSQQLWHAHQEAEFLKPTQLLSEKEGCVERWRITARLERLSGSNGRENR